MNNRGDWISFISDTDGVWPFPEDSVSDIMKKYQEMTDKTIDDLIKAGILIDEGKESHFVDEPEIYTRKLRNIWMEE